MATTSKKRRIFEVERDVLDFARSYLADTFPNLEREDCPPDNSLRLLASRPMQSAEWISDHLTSCSPCFNAYMAHLAHARAEILQSQRRQRITSIRRSLLAAGMAAIVVIAIYAFLMKRQSYSKVASTTQGTVVKSGPPAHGSATAIPSPVLIDLSNASPVRGIQGDEACPSPQVIPSTPLLDVKLRLPLGSEKRVYTVSLRFKRHVVWSTSARAHLENGQMLLHMRADFSHVPLGSYDLVTVSTGFRIAVPVIVREISPGSFK